MPLWIFVKRTYKVTHESFWNKSRKVNIIFFFILHLHKCVHSHASLSTRSSKTAMFTDIPNGNFACNFVANILVLGTMKQCAWCMKSLMIFFITIDIPFLIYLVVPLTVEVCISPLCNNLHLSDVIIS